MPDNRRLEIVEIVADGTHLFQGAQLAVDTTLVSALRRDGVPHSRAANHNGAVLDAARCRKERIYPELTGQFGRTRLVVLAGEVAGRWSEESRDFLSQLARAKSGARTPPFAGQSTPSLAAQVGGRSWFAVFRKLLPCGSWNAEEVQEWIVSLRQPFDQ